MSKTNLVRPSRDGDQFHYLWAARRCLNLLSADSGLVAVTIEGPSPDEQTGGSAIDAGEELIDIAEYLGSEDINRAHLVRYMQLKHSTLHADDAWTASGLEKTLRGFARRYSELEKVHGRTALANGLCARHEAAALLSWYLPTEPQRAFGSRFAGSRFPLLRAYCLRAALQGQPLELVDLAHVELKEEIKNGSAHSKSRELHEFEEDIGSLLPWHKLWAAIILDEIRSEDVALEIKKTSEISRKAERGYYAREHHTSNEIALLWMDIPTL